MSVRVPVLLLVRTTITITTTYARRNIVSWTGCGFVRLDVCVVVYLVKVVVIRRGRGKHWRSVGRLAAKHLLTI